MEGRTIFLRNLPFNVTEEELEQRSEFALETSSHGFCSFSTYGALKYCVLTIDKVTGLPKGAFLSSLTGMLLLTRLAALLRLWLPAI